MPAPPLEEYATARMNYLDLGTPRSLVATGKVGTRRDEAGTDTSHFGISFSPQPVRIMNGRGSDFSLDGHGFCLVGDPLEHVDYLNEAQILHGYYPACCELVRRATGASRVVAFDHNVRSSHMFQAGKRVEGGNAVQQPAPVVHNDYTVTSARQRVLDLTKPPKINDTLRPLLGGEPLLDPAEAERLLAGRWAIINVWRNTKPVPVEAMPLALCVGPSVPLQDYVVFEIHYADRVGENYWAAHSEGHQWVCFPRLTRDEAILLKCWDSAGADFRPAGSGPGGGVPATFSLHSAFEDPTSPPGADDRVSIEVRTIAFFADPAAPEGAAPARPAAPSSRL